MADYPPTPQVHIPKVKGTLMVALLDNGQVQVDMRGMSRNEVLMACESAKFSLMKKFEEALNQPGGIVTPPPGLRVPRTEGV
jgi:hypothetical protein